MIIKNLNFEDKKCKICACLPAADLDELRTLLASPLDRADLLEWRLDYFLYPIKDKDANFQIRALIEANKLIKSSYPDKALLISLRSCKDGGLYDGDDSAYLKLMEDLTGVIKPDLLDLEYKIIKKKSERIEFFRKFNIPFILSYHDFDKTPDEKMILNIIDDMWNLGAYIAKIALMANCPEDVIRLMKTSLSAHKKNNKLISAISMGKIGALSRLSSLGASCISFAECGKATAPGQVPLPLLRRIIDFIE